MATKKRASATAQANATDTDAMESDSSAPAADRSESAIVSAVYDNDAVAGNAAVRICTLTFSDGATATGTTPRTDDLAADQAQARAQAIASVAA